MLFWVKAPVKLCREEPRVHLEPQVAGAAAVSAQKLSHHPPCAPPPGAEIISSSLHLELCEVVGGPRLPGKVALLTT